MNNYGIYVKFNRRDDWRLVHTVTSPSPLNEDGKNSLIPAFLSSIPVALKPHNCMVSVSTAPYIRQGYSNTQVGDNG